MTSRWIIVVSLIAILATAALGLLALSQSGKQSLGGLAGGVAVQTADKPISDPYPGAQEVRLFVETENEDHKRIYVRPAGRTLTEGQRAEFESTLAIHTVSPDELFAACFIPHHFFRYFDGAGKLVGEVQVCFCCAGVQSEGSNVQLGEDQMLAADFRKLKTLVASLGERTDVYCD